MRIIATSHRALRSTRLRGEQRLAAPGRRWRVAVTAKTFNASASRRSAAGGAVVIPRARLGE